METLMSFNSNGIARIYGYPLGILTIAMLGFGIFQMIG